MYIVIAGAGLVGASLAQRLVEAKHDVVVVDQSRDVCEHLAAGTGALVVCGSASSIDTLTQAGIERADVAVATMRMDADNIAFAILSKSFEVPHIVARMRDRRYEAAYKEAGVTATSHIVDVFVNQLLLEIDEPHLRQIATFGAGQASIVVDTIPEGAAASGKTISELAADPAFPEECVISGVYRPGSKYFAIPRGSTEIQEGDRVFLVARLSDLRKASKFLHRKR